MNVPRNPAPSSLSRRVFLAATGAGAVAAVSPRVLLAVSATPAKDAAFNTANFVARVSGYRYQLSQWMEQHNKTIAATDEAAWRAICKEIAAAGFKAVEVWEAHAAPAAAPGAGPTEPPPADELDQLLAAWTEARAATGQPAAGLSRERLAAQLEQQRAAIRERFGATEVRFRVVVEDGRAKLKASPVTTSATRVRPA